MNDARGLPITIPLGNGDGDMGPFFRKFGDRKHFYGVDRDNLDSYFISKHKGEKCNGNGIVERPVC
jgi:hypothetical protein